MAEYIAPNKSFTEHTFKDVAREAWTKVGGDLSVAWIRKGWVIYDDEYEPRAGRTSIGHHKALLTGRAL
jgi:hypothetical protein